MQAYGPVFSRIYNLRWGGFARQIAPRLLDYYEVTPLAVQNRTILDLCCGAGHLALYFLEHGYQVIGIDLSENMLQYARQNASDYIAAGKARFIQADAADFTLDQQVGLVVSTYDALNHLENFAALQSCFRSVFAVLADRGSFIFDLNTRTGLKRWNSVSIEDSEDITLIQRGIYDGVSDRAQTRITGYIRTPNGVYERFEETVYNTVFEIQSVNQALLEAGWRAVHNARATEINIPINDPESEGRVFFVARK